MSWITHGVCVAALLVGCTKDDSGDHGRAKPVEADNQRADTEEARAGAARARQARTRSPVPRRPPVVNRALGTKAKARMGTLRVLHVTPRINGRWNYRADGGSAARVCRSGDYVVWADSSTRHWKMPLQGGRLQPLGARKSLGFSITCRGSKLYGNRDNVLFEHMPNGTIRDIATLAENPLHIVFDGSDAYMNLYKTPGIWKVPLAGGKPTRIINTRRATTLAVDGDTLYWTDYASGIVAAYNLRSGRRRTLARGQKRPIALAVDATHVYWGEETPGTIRRVSKKGGRIQTLIKGAVNHDEIAVYKGHVYWRSWEKRQGGHYVARVPVGGGATQVVIDAMHMPEDLHFAGDWMLLTNKGERALLALTGL